MTYFVWFIGKKQADMAMVKQINNKYERNRRKTQETLISASYTMDSPPLVP
jgi:hypothetical protein